MSSNIKNETFPVTGMSCAGCVSSVEKALNNQENIIKAEVNFATKNVQIEYLESEKPETFKKVLNDIGFDIIVKKEEQNQNQESRENQELKSLKARTLWSLVLSLPVFVFGMFFMDWPLGQYLSFVLTGIVLFRFGKSFFINAFKLAKRKSASMDTLVALSTGIAFLFSSFSLFYPEYWLSKKLEAHVYFEAAALIIVFISLGRFIEEKAKSNTNSAIKSLIGLQAKTVLVLEGDIEKKIPIEKVIPGMTIVVKPGQNIPVDGLVITGHSFVNESMLTGESVALEKFKGEKVYAGTINQKGRLVMEAQQIGKTTRLGQIIQAVQKAQGSKAPVQKLVDKIAGIFVPTVLVLSLITFICWYIFGGEHGLTHGFLTSITVLIIACPCALGLATPTAIMVGMGKGAENGILIKNAESLEIGNKVTAVVLDKTGTITKGKPKVTDVFFSNSELYQSAINAILNIESQSNHPLAGSVTSFLSGKPKEIEYISDFETIIGKGIKAKFKKEDYLIGNKKLIEQSEITISNEFSKAIEELESLGKSLVFVSRNGELIVVYGISDEIKPNSKKAISDLQNQGIKVVMLTGDHYLAGKRVAESCGIKHYETSQLPRDKSDYIKKLQSENHIVAMVGDGINDTEALATANLSMAIGEGADIAMDVANVTLIHNDLGHVSKAINLSKFTVKGIRQNLFWAFIYNVIGIPIAAGVIFPINGFLLDPMIAGGAMAFSSVSVVLNSLRLKRKSL